MAVLARTAAERSVYGDSSTMPLILSQEALGMPGEAWQMAAAPREEPCRTTGVVRRAMAQSSAAMASSRADQPKSLRSPEASPWARWVTATEL